ncbi:MAG: hypothetical protein JO126_06755, partial [Alphaproteobacteria bacterium]|nr:hypothetical protein [Alphaproteobacteria bacterium]
MTFTLPLIHVQIVLAPLLPWQGLVVFAVVGLVFSLYALMRRVRGGVLRGLLVLAVTAVLADPSLLHEKREAEHDVVLLVIDQSASMTLGHRAALAKQAEEQVRQKLAAFDDVDVQTVTVAGQDETDLLQAVQQKLQNIPADHVAGIIAITDGQVHDTAKLDVAIPFHILLTGRKGEIDRRLVVKEAPGYGMVGGNVKATIRVEDAPVPQAAMAALTVQQDDGTKQQIAVPVNKDTTLDLPMRHAGQNAFALSVETVPSELTQQNNQAFVTVNGIRDRLRVLLVSGEPHSGTRTWRNFLKADASVDLVHFTILRTPYKLNTVPNNELALIPFPVRELFVEKLSQFDLVIFDRFTERNLMPPEYLEKMADYVDNGGAMLISHATDRDNETEGHSPLARILPGVTTGRVITGAFVPDVTPVGLRHPVTATLADIFPRDQWGDWYRQVDMQAVRGEVLLQGQGGKPLLILDHVGKGRVAEFASDQFWLWARQGDVHDPAHGDASAQSGPQGELLRRVAHWLMQEPALDETALSAQAQSTDAGWQLQIHARNLHDPQVNVTLAEPDGQMQDVTLRLDDAHQLSATLPVTQTGLYKVMNGGQQAWAMVGNPNVPERGDVVVTDKILAPYAAASGGGVLWLDDPVQNIDIRRDGLLGARRGWGGIGLRQNHAYRVTGSTLWP